MKPNKPRLFVVALIIVVLLAGMAGDVLAQGAGEQLCHPSGYCVTVPAGAGWTGMFEQQNNVLSAANVAEGLNLAVQLTYAPGMGNQASLTAMTNLVVSALQGAASGQAQAVTLAGYTGSMAAFQSTAADVGAGMVAVLIAGPDVMVIAAGARTNGAAWDATAQAVFEAFVNSLVIPATLDVSQIIGGEAAPPGVVINAPQAAGAASSGAEGIGGAALGGLPAGSAGTAGTLAESFTTALAATQWGDGDTASRIAVLSPAAGGASLMAVPEAYGLDELLGWQAANRLVVFRRAADTYGAPSIVYYDIPDLTETTASVGALPSWGYALTPDQTQIVSWPIWPEDSQYAHVVGLMTADAQTFTPTGNFSLSAPQMSGVAGMRLVGLSDVYALFATRQPAGGLIAVRLEDGTVAGPVTPLGGGEIQSAAFHAGAPLVIVGRVNNKDPFGVYTADLGDPGMWPAEAQATAHALPEGSAGAQGVVWNHAGSQAAIVSALPDDFSASAVYLSDPTFDAPVVTSARAAFNTCVLFTPDDAWLFYVGETGDSLLAIPVADPAASPQTVITDLPGLDLCSADWQPGGAGGGVTISGGQGQPGGGVTLGAGNTITVGQTVTGQITQTQGAEDYSITLGAGEAITATMRRLDGNLDPYLIILDATGRELVFNDDAAAQVGDSFLNAQIVDFTPPAAGTYTIRATHYGRDSGTSTGRYELSVTAGAAQTQPVGQGGGAIEVGQTVTGEITNASFTFDYTISLKRGDVITVTMTRLDGNLDTYLFLLDSTQRELTHNDDAATPVGDTGLNAQIPNFTAPADGTYIIRATRFGQQNGSSTGRYELSVTAGSASGSGGGVTLPGGNALTVGQPVTGQITNAQSAVDYTITLNAGDVITVTMTRLDGDLDAYLFLLDSTQRELTHNDDAATPVGNTGLNAQIPNFTAPAAGTYIIRATRYGQQNGTSTGRYELSVTAGGAALPGGGGGATQAGSVVLTLTWNNRADLDLATQGPDGILISFENPNGANGVTLQATAGNDYCRTFSSPAVETITIPPTAPRGQWAIGVQYSLECNDTTPANYTVTAVQNGVTLGSWSGTLYSRNDDVAVYTLQLQ